MDNKSFRDRANDDRDELVAFWGSPRGLATAAVIGVGIVTFFVLNVVGVFA